MTGVACLALLSHWRRHPGQLLILVLGLALATALWTGVQAINAEARAAYDKAARVVGQSDYPKLVPDTGRTLPLETYVALRRAGWSVAPVIEGRLRIGENRYRLIGLDPLTAPSLPAAQDASSGNGGPAVDPGAALLRFLSPPGEIRAHPETVAEIDRTQVTAQLVPSEELPPGTLVTDIGIAETLLRMEGRLSHLLVLSPPGGDLPPLDQIAQGLRQAEPVQGTDTRGLTNSFHLNLTAFGGLSFVVGLFIVHGTIGLAFEQRRSTMRTLRALGLPLGRLMGVMLGEALILALVAGGLGVALGYGLAALLLPDVAATLRGLYGAQIAGSISLRPQWWAAGMAMAVAGTLLAAGHSLWLLSRLPVLAASRPRAWAMANRRQLRGLALMGGLSLVLALGCVLLGTGLGAGFGALSGLLLGAALILPWLLSLGLTWAARRAQRPVAQWVWADARQQVPELSLALMALLLALSANIGVSTMVSSFRATFEGWLEQRLAADLYMSFPTETQATAALPWLEAHSAAVLPIPRIDADLGGAPGLVYGMRDHATYREAWPLLSSIPQSWDRLAAGAGMLINEQWSHRADLRPGDRATLDGQDVTVLGIYSDYGNPRPQAILGLDRFRDHYPDVAITQFALRTEPARSSDLAQDILDRFDLPSDRVTEQAAIKEASRQVFERTFAATDALNLLTLAVAGFAIFASLLSLQSLRLPQVAPLWALGLTHRHLATIDLLRSGLLAMATAVLALPTGLALAWVLLAVVNVEAFGWRLPLRLFPWDWAVLIATAVLAAIVAAALPARALARRQPADLLRVFSHAR